MNNAKFFINITKPSGAYTQILRFLYNPINDGMKNERFCSLRLQQPTMG
jgi:hypothetical protein